MADKKIIAVAGATGAQGGGLCRAILNDKDSEFAVRALTRDPNSDKAKALAALGAEVVAADLDDEESVTEAFKGAYGAYCVTFFWEHFSVVKEQGHARTLARAAKANDVKHVIWSTLEDTRQWVPLDDDRMPTLQGKYKVPHYDSKGSIDHFFTDLGLPVTLMRTSFYWDSLYMFKMGPSQGKGDEFELTFPMGDKQIPGIAAEDIGGCAYGIFKAGDKYIGETLGLVGENLTGEQMAGKLATGMGLNVKYFPVTPDTYRGFYFPGSDDIGNMFQVWADFETEYMGNRSYELTKELNPNLRTFDQWLKDFGHNLQPRITGKDLMQWSLDHHMLSRQLYFYISIPIQGPTRVMQQVEVHLQHLYRLEREGLLYAAGPFSDCNSDSDFPGGGIIILRAKNMEHAKQIADSDPFHVTGCRTYQLYPWVNNEGRDQIDFTKSTMEVKYWDGGLESIDDKDQESRSQWGKNDPKDDDLPRYTRWVTEIGHK